MATRLNLKAAAAGKYHHNFNPVTITSLDFAELLPTRVIETTLGEAWNSVKAGGVLRMVPQTFPPYGKLFIKNATFFVPENQLIFYSDAFHSKKLTYQGKPVMNPGYYYHDFLYYMASLDDEDYCVANHQALDPLDTQQSMPDPDTYDFILPYYDSTAQKVLFDAYECGYKGRRIMKLFKLLGVDIPRYKYYANSLDNTVNSGRVFTTALPLLAYLKIYVDMYLSGTFYNSALTVAFLRAVRDGENFVQSGTTLYNYSTGIIAPEILDVILHDVLTPHSGNMFLTAWNSLSSPDGVNPSSSMSDLNPHNVVSPVFNNLSTSSVPNQIVSGASSGIGVINTNGITGVSQESLFALHSVFQFITRNNLAGTKPAQELFARFGIKSEDFKSNFVHKISEGSQRIDFNAVMNNSASGGSVLGDYAGFGASGLNVDYSYDASAYGYLITLHWLQIEPIVMRGTHAMNLRKDGFDFYTAEYDGKASRAIPYMELTGDKDVRHTATGPGSAEVYGFVPLYQDYREMRDSVAGSFLRGKAQKFMFGRDFSKLSGFFKPQSNKVQYYSNDDNADLTNPYNTFMTAGDRFFLYLDWDISAELPILNDEDTYNLDGKGDTVITKNGKMLS